MNHEARAPAKWPSKLGFNQRVAQRARHGDVRFGKEVQMPELLLAHVKVSAVDDLLVAELPVRARVDAVPTLDAASNRLARPIEGRTRREVALFAELHHP